MRSAIAQVELSHEEILERLGRNGRDGCAKLRPGRHKLELKNRHHAIRFTAYITIRAKQYTTFVRRFSRP